MALDLHEDILVCDCKQIYLQDIKHALFQLENIQNIEHAVRGVQELLGCGTVCGKCRSLMTQVVAELMYLDS
ncbi:MAG: (2Fe-2S)-binding protein [Clostridia bacterium]|nr:(2Fe-2S)-binding protein [Clostridia bacterium]